MLLTRGAQDSFRWAEALEQGCIPIVEDDPPLGSPLCERPMQCTHNDPNYFRRLLGESFPFLVVREWGEAPHLLRALLADPHRLHRLFEECVAWFESYKDRLGVRVAERLKLI
jgi:hypothetical protein